MNKTESTILESKTPEDYIDRSLKARLPPASKAKLARHWMEATGYSKEDILRARNRHPYWKRKKMEGSAERTRRRLAAHDYSSGGSVQWDQALVTQFLDLNRKGQDGRYERKDWQLAERFGATIPSIQYMRRKLSKVESLLGNRASQSKVVEYLLRAESVLSRGKEAVEELKASRKPAAQAKATGKTAAKKPAVKAGKKPTAAKPAKTPAKPVARRTTAQKAALPKATKAAVRKAPVKAAAKKSAKPASSIAKAKPAAKARAR